MLRRTLILAALALGLAPVASDAVCGTVTTRNSARLSFDTVVIVMHENQPNDVCSQSPGVTPGPIDRRLKITVGDLVVCDRTTDIDPSFDPFFFGAGLHPDPSISCGADFTIVGLTTVATPDPSTIAVDPSRPSAQAGLTKHAVTETPGRYWYGSTSAVIPQDSSGTVTRGAGLSGSP